MMNTIPLHFSIPAYIATNPSTGICNVYDHLPQRLDNGDYAGNIILTLGVKGTGEIPDRINYWSLQGIELPKPGTKPIRFTLALDLSNQGHPITESSERISSRSDFCDCDHSDCDSSDIAVDLGGRSTADIDPDFPFSQDDLDFIFDEDPIKKFP